jgi:hypothetical protein
MARNSTEAKQTLLISDQWARENQMIFNVDKCGTMGSKVSLEIHSRPIPKVKTYRYLGVPLTYSGVDWCELIKSSTQKFKDFLNATRHKSYHWTFPIKISIFKTFLRPVIEYALPMATIWMGKPGKRQSTAALKTLLLECHQEALSWIFNRTSKFELLEKLSGIGSLSTRIEILQASLAIHLSLMHIDNPLKVRMESFFLTANCDELLSHVNESIAFKEFKKQLCSWTVFKSKYLKTSMMHSNSKLASYINGNCSTKSGIDKCLLHRSAKTFLAWRSNTLFLHRKCPVCTKTFNRAHIQSCISSALPKSLKLRIEQNMNGQTNILDYMLNNMQYDDAYNVIHWIQEKMDASY